MPASAEFYENMGKKLKAASDKKNSKLVDDLLDFWNDQSQLATDYDAYEWGFNPDTWSKHHRNVMEDRISSLNKPDKIEMP